MVQRVTNSCKLKPTNCDSSGLHNHNLPFVLKKVMGNTKPHLYSKHAEVTFPISTQALKVGVPQGNDTKF